MKTPIDKLNFGLKIYYATTIVISIIAFMLTVAYTTKYSISAPNTILERYSIIITLIGIPLSLKIFHNKLKSLKLGTIEAFSKGYKQQYIIRLSILTIICFFNIGSLYITGSKNFYFMVIVTIFAFFLCAPQKARIDETTNEENEIE